MPDSDHAVLVVWEEEGFYVLDICSSVPLWGPYPSYEDAILAYIEEYQAVRAWDWFLPSPAALLSAPDIKQLYLEGKREIDLEILRESILM